MPGRQPLIRRGGVLAALGALCVALTACDAAGVAVAVPSPTGPAATACRSLVAALPDDVVLGQHRVATRPASPYTAAFGRPAVTVRCDGRLPPHDPTSDVLGVDGVDWLVLPASGGAEHFVAYAAMTHLAVDIPHAYLPADVLPALSPLVARFG